ncbi:hypothetical protein BGW42_000511 [Actinomortierella wolfii]|nr:hypothetical protein BGW42_000511 [Actinomortierella wolfii]
MYQGVTWKENLDAFHRRLRRGSLSLDASMAEDEIQAAASQTPQQAKGRGPSDLRVYQDENSHLLGIDGDSNIAGDADTSYKSASYGTMNQSEYHSYDPTLTGGHPPFTTTSSNHNTPGSAAQRQAGANSADPVFPVTLNPALATTKPASKLGTFSGVFIPSVLSIWGIILFLRFGFIIGQVGVVGTLTMFVVGYLIDVLTTFSLSAISSNGTVRGGGPYYLISRSLGPEFGGSIGLIYFLGAVLAGGMNVLGFVEPLVANFGEATGTVYQVLPEGAIWQFMYGTILLVLCTLICLVGAKLFSKTSLALAVVIFLSTVSIFVSFALVPAFTIPERNIEYTGFSLETLKDNLWPQFTTDGPDGPMFNFQVVFGILFPACTGILAGASMSGDLQNPSRSIPRGTLWAVGSTFVVYTAIVILMGGSIVRATMHTDMNILQDISLSPLFIASGALATSIFATLGSVIGAAKILQAIARDNLLPILTVFSQGTPKTDEPTLAVLLTYVLTQLCLFVPNMNAIAAFVSLSTLLTFAILNLACFLLKVGSAPNFRPRFRFFHWWTAFAGMILSVLAMSFMDLGKTVLSGLLTSMLFIWIHYSSPPKRWGDVTQSLIYHQVRKYLLRLDSRKDHVKFWRPQILLLVHHPRSEYRLIQFCNHLKKGALYVLGHVIVGDLRDLITEYRRQQSAWLKFVDVLQIKAFVNISVADSVRIGARNLLLSTGLGGMRPNIVVLGSFNMKRYLSENGDEGDMQLSPQAVASAMPFAIPSSPPVPPPAPRSPTESSPMHTLLNIPMTLPTDSIRAEKPITITDYVSIIEDVLALNKAVAIAYGFDRLELPEDSRCKRSARGMFDFGTKPPKRRSSAKAQYSRPSHRHHRHKRQHHESDVSDSDSSLDSDEDERRSENILQRSWRRVSASFGLGDSRDSGSRRDYGKEWSSLLYRSTQLASPRKTTQRKKKFIDLWPMQMTVVQTVQDRRTSRDFDTNMDSGGMYHQRNGSSSAAKAQQQDVLTNFDTYTMVLQMGCILHMVPYWKENYILRVMVFVEYEQDVAPEQQRLEELLENLRIPAEVKVMCLESGDSETYLHLVYGVEEPDVVAQDYASALDQQDTQKHEAAAQVPVGQNGVGASHQAPRNMDPQWRQTFSSSPTSDERTLGSHQTAPLPLPTDLTVNHNQRGLSPSSPSSPPSTTLAPAHATSPLSSSTQTRTLNHQGSMPQISISPINASVAAPSTGAATSSLHDRGSSDSAATPLRINTAVSPRHRQTISFTSPLGNGGGSSGATNLQRHRSLMVGGNATGGGVRNRPRHFSVSTGSGMAVTPLGSNTGSMGAERLGTSAPQSMSMNYRIGVPHPKHFDSQASPSESDSESDSSEEDEDNGMATTGATSTAVPLCGGHYQMVDHDASGLYSQPWQNSPKDYLPITTTTTTSGMPIITEGSTASHLSAMSMVEDNPWASSAPGVSSSTGGGMTTSGPPPVLRPSPRVGSSTVFTSLEATPEMDEDEESSEEEKAGESIKKEKEMEQDRPSRPSAPLRQPSGLGIQLAKQKEQQNEVSRRGPAATGPGASLEGHEGEFNSSAETTTVCMDMGASRVASTSTEEYDRQHQGELSSVTVGSSFGQTGGQSSPTSSSSKSSSSCTRSLSGENMEPRLQFDHLSPEDQLQIVNELMRVHSSSETTSILFTTVPAPEPGTCLSEESSMAYLENMEILMQDIEIPVLLIHAKSLTVTMTL